MEFDATKERSFILYKTDPLDTGFILLGIFLDVKLNMETAVLKENLHVKTVMTWTTPGYLEGLLKFTITTVKERNLFMIRHLILQIMK